MGKGLLLINTGPGKGKTTAALGTVVRALGHGFKVAFFQFIKSQETGESLFLKKYAESNPGQLHYNRVGLACFMKEPTENDRIKAREALKMAHDLIRGDYDLVVLDELCVTLKIGLLTLEEVLPVIKDRPEKLNLILTGRGCPPEIIDMADTATEMTEIKHAFNQGVAAKKGIEF